MTGGNRLAVGPNSKVACAVTNHTISYLGWSKFLTVGGRTAVAVGCIYRIASGDGAIEVSSLSRSAICDYAILSCVARDIDTVRSGARIDIEPIARCVLQREGCAASVGVNHVCVSECICR